MTWAAPQSDDLSRSAPGPGKGRALRLVLAADLSAEWLEWLGEALCPGDRPLRLPPNDWDRAFPSLWRHGLWPLVYVRLRDDPLWDRLPSPVRSKLAEGFGASALRAWRLEREHSRVLAALVASGVRVALLKGAAVSRVVYADPAERPMGDLDLLVPAQELEAARTVLEGLGYRPSGLTARGRLGRWQRAFRAELPMLGSTPPCEGLLVELHWSLAELPYYTDRIDMREVWASVQPVPGVAGVGIPAASFLLLHACAHLALHHSRDVRLIWLVDVDRLARWDRMDWQRLLRLAEGWRLGPALAGVLRATGSWLGTPLSPEVRVALEALAADPVGSAMWGLGDDRPGRGWRRARATWQAFDSRQRLRYGAWLFLRALTWPLEAVQRAARRRVMRGRS